jgi:hypothetical protein
MVTKLTASKLGEINSNFVLNDFEVYIMNTSATGGYVSTDWTLIGYTSAEKSFNPLNEQYVREDKIPRVPTYTKTIRVGAEISFDLSNQNEELEAIFKRGTIVAETGSNTGTRIAYGTDQAAVEYRAIRFVAKRDDNVNYTLTIPKAEITQNGEKTWGGESEVVTPLMVKAFYNPSAANTADLFYENYLDSGVSVTGDVPASYS